MGIVQLVGFVVFFVWVGRILRRRETRADSEIGEDASLRVGEKGEVLKGHNGP